MKMVLLPLLLVSALGAVQYSGAYNTDGPPPFFIFGDSTFDVGTNNFLLNSGAKANFPYNGIDFANSTPTGRFSNGFNSADQIVRTFGREESPPPYLSLVQDPSSFKEKILQGVNFASAGAGILEPTGKQTYGVVVPLGDQVQQFELVQGNITEALGAKEAACMLAESIILISVGSNDIFDHYSYNRTTVSLPRLMATLNLTYNYLLKKLFNLGARKFGIISAPPIGCCPFARLQNLTATRSPGCLTELNDNAQAFGLMMASLLERLSLDLGGDMKYSLANVYMMTEVLLTDPASSGIQDVEDACCGSGLLNAEQWCDINLHPDLCHNRSTYLFWDKFHPTEYAAGLVAKFLYTGGAPFVVPINFSELAQK